MSLAGDLLHGARLAFEGTVHAFRRGRVLTTCWPLFLTSLVLTLALQAAGVWAALRLTRGDDAHAWWAVAGMVALRFLGILAALALGAVLGLLLTALFVPLMAERIFLTSYRALDAPEAETLAGAPGLPLREEMVQALRRIARFLPRFLGALALSFVPILGLVAGPVAQAYVAARFLGWELLEPWFSRRSASWAEQITLLRQHRRVLLGFALPFVPALAIPLVGPFLFTVAQAAVVVLVREELRVRPESGAPG